MKNKQGGLIGTIFLVIVGLVLLKYFLNWDVFDAAKSPEGQETIGYTHQLLNTIWSYISMPVIFIWSKVVWPILALFWKTFLAFLAFGNHNLSSLSK